MTPTRGRNALTVGITTSTGSKGVGKRPVELVFLRISHIPFDTRRDMYAASRGAVSVARFASRNSVGAAGERGVLRQSVSTTTRTEGVASARKATNSSRIALQPITKQSQQPSINQSNVASFNRNLQKSIALRTLSTCVDTLTDAVSQGPSFKSVVASLCDEEGDDDGD